MNLSIMGGWVGFVLFCTVQIMVSRYRAAAKTGRFLMPIISFPFYPSCPFQMAT
jgi:hypothetical protein